MPLQNLSGNEALARGALEAGVTVVAGYPGSPASGVLEDIVEKTSGDVVYVEWSTNEKVALEVGIGASQAGRRALVCVKSVGMNTLIDPLMVVNLTGVHGGLVVLLGDDPGAYGSQNDQDSRPLSAFAEVPLLEPSTPADAKAMMKAAFSLSEELKTLVVVRETRSFSVATESVECVEPPWKQTQLGVDREQYRWVPYPKNAVALHAALHNKLEKIEAWANESAFNTVHGVGRRGVIAMGFAHTKLCDVVGTTPDDLRILKLGTVYPFPRAVVTRFLQECDEVLVIEENEPFVENATKVTAYDHGVTTKVYGKLSGHVGREGELFRWQIQEALAKFQPGLVPQRSYSSEREADEHPPRKSYCIGCPSEEIVSTLREVARSLGQEPLLTGDPGCLVRASGLLDSKFAMGSGVAVAQGLARGGVGERTVAIFGDSSFFHFALPGLMNAVYNRTPVLMVILDNGATVTSGFQANPGTGKDLRGRPAPRLSIEDISRTCGVEFIRTVTPDGDLEGVFREALSTSELGLVVVRWQCAHPDDMS